MFWLFDIQPLLRRDLLSLIGKMRLSRPITDEIAGVLKHSASVPMPGGHGVWFPDLRRRYRVPEQTATTEIRCYVCLALLGDGEGEQRWNPKEWWPHALAWFDIYCPDLAQRLDGPRWAYLLAAMLRVVDKWLDTQPQHRHLKTFAADCHSRAADRLIQMTRYGQKAGRLSQVPPISAGVRLTLDSDAWNNAALELEGPNAESVMMLHFMYVLHSQLGVAQHSMDERYATRVPFYAQIKKILDDGIGISPELREVGSIVAAAMSKTLLLSKANQPAFACANIAALLPSSFQLAGHMSKAPPRALIELGMDHAPARRDRLLAVYDLAVTVADLAMDIFRSGGIDGPAFKPGAYDYLHSVIRYGQKMNREREISDDLSSQESKAPDTQAIALVPMTRSFAERMRSGLLTEPARARIADDFGDELTPQTASPKI